MVRRCRLILPLLVGLVALFYRSYPLASQGEDAPRPVVMVHGFSSNATAWADYLGPEGYLASVGLQGFAVGDGQVEGTLNTGDLLDASLRTNTIAENAAILGSYIAQVKEATGASQVDLIAHSMGGLISRYYIDRVMQGRDVGQLIMLGSPQLGTDCANLPGGAGLYLPATLELRPSYVREIFNRQITHRHGVPFYIVAGTPIQRAIQSPCSAVPSDLVIAQESAVGIPATVTLMPLLHTDLNRSEQVFNDVVRPLLLRPTSEIPTEADATDAAPDEAGPPLQFTRVHSGHLSRGESHEFTIHIDAVTVAAFSLFDPTRSLTVTVEGASGKVLTLTPEQHALTVIDDPEMLYYLGYGFENPKPGPWQVTLRSSEQTPAAGADYALMAQYVGGATLDAQSSTLLPALGEAVTVSARLSLGGQALTVERASATIRAPDGSLETVEMEATEGDSVEATWQPSEAGLYGIDIVAEATSPDGLPVERAAFIAVEAQPATSKTGNSLLMQGAALSVALALLLIGGIFLARRRG